MPGSIPFFHPKWAFTLGYSRCRRCCRRRCCRRFCGCRSRCCGRIHAFPFLILVDDLDSLGKIVLRCQCSPSVKHDLVLRTGSDHIQVTVRTCCDEEIVDITLGPSIWHRTVEISRMVSENDDDGLISSITVHSCNGVQ